MAKGVKTGGGSRKGKPNKATKAREEVISASGLTPLEYMLLVLRDPLSEKADRLDAAKAAAPYVHPRLSAVTLKGDDKNPLRTVDMSREEFESTAREIAAEV